MATELTTRCGRSWLAGERQIAQLDESDFKGYAVNRPPWGSLTRTRDQGKFLAGRDPESTISATERLWHSRGTGIEYQGWIASN